MGVSFGLLNRLLTACGQAALPFLLLKSALICLVWRILSEDLVRALNVVKKGGGEMQQRHKDMGYKCSDRVGP